MSLRADAASVLVAMGYTLDVDFIAVQSGSTVSITWLSAQAMPSEATINAFDMSPAAVAAREDSKEPLLADLKAQAAGAVTTNNAFIAIASPSNAQVLAQVKALTLQNTRIIRGLYRVIQRTWRNGDAAP